MLNILEKAIKIKRRMVNWFNEVTPSESIVESKEKWNRLAREHAKYFIMSDYGKGIDEPLFKESGRKDAETLVDSDILLHKYLDPFSNKVILEIGCGEGRLSDYFTNWFEEVIGLDISETMISHARERLANKTNLKLFSTNGITYPVPNETVDFVFSFIVFQHMPDKKTVRKNFEETARVLKKGGIMKVQLRGIPAEKKHWYYGPAFDLQDSKKILEGLPFSLIKSEGENKKYFWLWLEKI
jgi:SAM-dependent methyltransferase